MILQPRYLIWGFWLNAQLQNSFQEEKPIARRQLDSLQLTFSLFQISEMRWKVVLRLIEMDFSKGDASIAPRASGNYASWKPSASLFPSDIWPQQEETGTKALILVLTSGKEGWLNSSWEQMKSYQTVSLFVASPAFLDWPKILLPFFLKFYSGLRCDFFFYSYLIIW